MRKSKALPVGVFSLASFRKSFWRKIHATRAERNIENFGLISVVSYYLKYLTHQKLDADPEIVNHFEIQKLIVGSKSAKRCVPISAVAKIGFIGDIMWIRDGQSESLTKEVHDFLSSFDAVIGNLETVISKSYSISSKLPDHMRFNSPEEILDPFQKDDQTSILTAVSVANNHILDFGEVGALDTLKVLKGKQISYSGVSQKVEEPSWVKKIVNGILIGFYGAGFGLNSLKKEVTDGLILNILPSLVGNVALTKQDFSKVESILDEMRRNKVEIKIIYLHWGHEFEHYPTSGQMQIARQIVSAGADVVIGSHSHVSQPDEVLFLNGKEQNDSMVDQNVLKIIPANTKLSTPDGKPRKAYVCYSLGNFLTAMFTEHCRKASVRSLNFFRNSEGEVDWNTVGLDILENISVPKSKRRKLVFWNS